MLFMPLTSIQTWFKPSVALKSCSDAIVTSTIHTGLCKNDVHQYIFVERSLGATLY